MRPRAITLMAVILAAVPASPSPATAQNPPTPRLPAFLPSAGLPTAAETGDEQTDRAVDRGIEFLLAQQDPTSGAINNPGFGPRLAVTNSALAIMALASVGYTPTDPTPQGRAMAAALSFVLRDGHQYDPAPGSRDAAKNSLTIGYFSGDQGRMYGHGITTLMLAEMLGMGVDEAQDRLIRERLSKAIDLIIRAQRMPKADPRCIGGWRYEPTANDADLSVSVWQVMALRAAHNAGMAVPAEVIQAAIKYLKGSYASPRDARGLPVDLHSGFSYQPGGGPTYSTAAEGLLALQVCGEYTAPEVIGAGNYLLNPRMQPNVWFYYGTYYYAQGMYQRGGEYAQVAATQTARLLLPQQSRDGAWTSNAQESREGGPVLTTSLAILSLSVKYHYLPIYQR
jgi:hypothetical protein